MTDRPSTCCRCRSHPEWPTYEHLHAENARLKTAARAASVSWSFRASQLEDRIEELDAELVELRKLKAKVDGLEHHPDDHAYVVRRDDRLWLSGTAGHLLAYLREPTT